MWHSKQLAQFMILPERQLFPCQICHVFLSWVIFEGLSTRDQTIPPVICHTYSFPLKWLAKRYANPPARQIQRNIRMDNGHQATIPVS